VRYQNTREGRVDDITLDELIESKRISHFFRPSEDRWVDILTDPVRTRTQANTRGLWRRASDCEGKVEKEEEPHHRFSGRFKRHMHRKPPKMEPTPEECFQQGFVAFHTTDDCEVAIRAFARSIQLDPTFERAYVHRGLAYEKFGNVQQAIEDYSRALLLDPSDGKLYYLRGLSFRRLGMDMEATADLRAASDLRYWPAYNLLKSTKICL
jgi:hypothetical protein